MYTSLNIIYLHLIYILYVKPLLRNIILTKYVQFNNPETTIVQILINIFYKSSVPNYT